MNVCFRGPFMNLVERKKKQKNAILRVNVFVISNGNERFIFMDA